MPKSQLQIDKLFDEALRRAPGTERAQYLDKACGDDVDLRRRIERLLQAIADAGSFLETPAQDRSPTLAPLIPEQPGTQIGSYKLLQQLGEGGMGIVYMAEQTEPIERRVALKIIQPGMDTRQVIARFDAERQALAMMDHPNIAKVLDAGTTDSGRPYFVMELVKGVPITQYCDAKQLTPRERLELLLPVCHAVQHAHQKGIIHRDIKPSNVLVALYDDKPVPKVIDFGVAKATNQRLTDRTMFTQYGQIVGTVEYMSPEQAQLNQMDVDTRSDIYSLGVLLYELLVGETPFDRQRLRSAAFDELLRIIREEEPLRPSLRASTSESLRSIAANRLVEPNKLSMLVRGELDWIVMKAMEKDRTRRYETANGLASDLRRYLDDEPVTACPPSFAYRLRKFARRNKGFLVTIFLVGATLLLGTVVSTGLAIHAMSSARAEQKAHQEADQAVRVARQRLFDTYVAHTIASRWSGRPGQQLDTIDAAANAAALIDSLGLGEEERAVLRDQVIAAMALADLRTQTVWKGQASEPSAIFSPDLQLCASFGPGEPVRIRRVCDSMTDAVVIAQTGPSEFVRFDPTNRFLLGFPPLRVSEISTGKDVLTCSNDEQFDAADFDPQGRMLAVGDIEGNIRVFDLTSWQEIRRFSVDSGVQVIKFSPNGHRLAVSRFDNTFEIRDVATGEAVSQGPQLSGIGTLAWRPDGQRLAVAKHGDIHMFELPRLDPSDIVCRGHQSRVVGLEFHPNGQLLASTSWDGTTRIWDAGNGEQLLRADGHFDQFSPDGRRLAFRQGVDRGIWEVSSPQGCRWLQGGWTIAVAIGRRGRLLAATHRDGVSLWDLDRAEQVTHLAIGDTRDVAFDPVDGSLVTSGPYGFYRWPLEMQSAGSDELLRLGPPSLVDESVTRSRTFEFSRDGRTLVVEGFFQDEAFIVHTGGKGQRRYRLTGAGLTNVALSPDGKWATTSSPRRTAVWDARSGEHVLDLAVSGIARLGFSPNSRRLVTSNGLAIGIWEVGTWRIRHEIPIQTDAGCAVTFTPDSRLAAVGLWGVGIRLIDVETGRTIATLEAAHRPPVYADLAFTPDGAILAASADALGLCVWDLRAIRSQLASMQLDWDLPPIPSVQGNSSLTPLNIQVDLGSFRVEPRSMPATPLDESHVSQENKHADSQAGTVVPTENPDSVADKGAANGDDQP